MPVRWAHPKFCPPNHGAATTRQCAVELSKQSKGWPFSSLPSNYEKCEKNWKGKQDVLLKILKKLEQQVKYKRTFRQ